MEALFNFLNTPVGIGILVFILIFLSIALLTGAKVKWSKEHGISIEGSEKKLFSKKKNTQVNPFFIKVLKDVVDSEVDSFISSLKNEESLYNRTLKQEKSFITESIKRNIEVKIGEIILVEDNNKNYDIYELYLARDLTKIILNHIDVFIDRNVSNENELDSLIVSEVDEIIKDLKIKVNKYTLLSQHYIEKILNMYDKLGHDVITIIQDSVKKCIDAKNTYNENINKAKSHLSDTVKEKIDSTAGIEVESKKSDTEPTEA